MKQFIYNERVYSDLDSLYKENRKDNLVTLENFKENINVKNMSIEDSLTSKELSVSELESKDLNKKYNDPEYLFMAIMSYFMFFYGFFIAYNSDLYTSEGFYSGLFMFIGLFGIFSFTISGFKFFTRKAKAGRKRIQELEPIIEQEHKDLEAKIEEELKVI
ncbi:hypothetical protein [Vreelandella neptunia]|uniref:Uncharacterized protein n=1 Tax=Vreelandella neptunia TaxID=115551 RepID=A0ABS9S9T4_9GAMM|nr:hypothetical protein [Halomonas neptunia]MCH4812878.1 hypothetical protein [Halomonas neptunia]